MQCTVLCFLASGHLASVFPCLGVCVCLGGHSTTHTREPSHCKIKNWYTVWFGQSWIPSAFPCHHSCGLWFQIQVHDAWLNWGAGVVGMGALTCMCIRLAAACHCPSLGGVLLASCHSTIIMGGFRVGAQCTALLLCHRCCCLLLGGGPCTTSPLVQGTPLRVGQMAQTSRFQHQNYGISVPNPQPPTPP